MSFEEFREAGDFVDDEDYSTQERSSSAGKSNYFLGITPAQRFVLAILLLVAVCLLGTFFLVATGKIVPPGLN